MNAARHIARQLPPQLKRDLAAEFDRDQLSHKITQSWKMSPEFSLLRVLDNPVTLIPAGDPAIWIVTPDSSPIIKEAWGLAAIIGTATTPQGTVQQLFVWMRGAFRNLGLGGFLLDEAIGAIKQNVRGATLSVDLGPDTPGNLSDRERKAAWLRFYGQRGFIRGPDHRRLRLTLELLESGSSAHV